jgi:DNA-binding transcriptional LysR family regulator
MAEGFDAVIRHGRIEDSRLVAWTLARGQRRLVASPDYLARHGQPQSPADLAGHRAIYYLNRGIADWRFEGEGTEPTDFVRPPAALRVNNGDMMRDAALAGLGMAMLPSFIVGQDIRAGTLKVVDIGLQAAPEYLYVAHPEGRKVSAKLRALVDWLRTAFGDPPYWEVGRRGDVSHPRQLAVIGQEPAIAQCPLGTSPDLGWPLASTS